MLMEISTPWREEILAGRKTVEVRKNDPKKWGAVKPKDVLHVCAPGDDSVTIFVVKDVRTYKDLDTMLIVEGLRNVLPGITSLEEAKKVYLTIDGTTMNAIMKRMAEYDEHGLIAIELTRF